MKMKFQKNKNLQILEKIKTLFFGAKIFNEV